MSALSLVGAGYAGGAASFAPDQISGLKLWLKADAITGLIDGDPVGTWADSSGQGNDATQATSAKKPTYQTNELNGLPVVRFDGVDDQLVTPALVLFPSKRGSLFMVFRNLQAAGYGALAATFLGAGVTWEYMSSRTGPAYKFYNSISTESAAANDTANWEIEGLLRRTNTTIDLYNNGDAVEGLSHADVQFSSSVSYLGSASAFEYINVEMAEYLIYDVVPSETERTNLLNYLNDKYGVY